MLRWWQAERGVQTLEWVALALVVLALMGAVTRYLSGPGGAQVAAPIRQALQQYVWCLEGAGACPGAGSAVGDGSGIPGARPPGTQPPGARSPSGPTVRPDFSESRGHNFWDGAWKWLTDRWEDAKRTATQVWQTLQDGARAIWNWLDEHKGIVAGGLTALLILGVAAGIALLVGLTPLGWAIAIGAALGALLFGFLYHFGAPKDQQTWGGAFAFVAQGAAIGGLLASGGAALWKLGISGILKLAMGKGAIGGISSAISYFLTTPLSEIDLPNLGLAVAGGVLTEMIAGDFVKAALGALIGTIQDAREGKISWRTPLNEFAKTFIGDKLGRLYNKQVFGSAAARGIGQLRQIGIRLNPPKSVMQIANRISWEVIKKNIGL
ncbi:MAG: hypothetical protein RMM10_05705 [Anaerolineae bacterium]|uniref:hypothetical protein n=1 Tax=Thermoflexus sp. TaxID=1969742 RepID=UPI0025FDB9DD|nr:hypothetical protein [Thermoflexus sp.]MCS7351006.1 hypothetical protein [Thermoflexus sp.]MDW8180458.1 hypothetical protein [Anaerolineae bacterium]